MADVSAFANSTSGDLVYGIDEDGEARASALTPVAGNPDEEVRRLLDTILNGLDALQLGLTATGCDLSGLIQRASWPRSSQSRTALQKQNLKFFAPDSESARMFLL